MENNERVCHFCGEVVPEDNYYEFEGIVMCEDCYSERTSVCDFCGDTMWAEDAESDGYTTVCPECFDDHYYRCDRCHDLVRCDDTVTDGNTHLCEGCYDDYYSRCDNCGTIIDSDDTHWHNDYPYCQECYDRVSKEDSIHDYYYKPDPIFYGGDGCACNTRFFGVELEIDGEGEDADSAKEILDIANIGCEHIYCKHDGSLGEGFEIVTHPMTIDYHMSKMPWKGITEKALDLGYRSHNTSTCGLHIHVSRDALGTDREKQEDVIARILFFVEKHWNEIFKFSRRSKHSMDRWAARYGYEKSGKDILKKAKNGSNGRYAAVNLRNYNTIEFRLFRGTLKLNTIYATLQFVNRVIDIAMKLSEADIDKMSWSEFVQGINEPELIQYLKERSLYVNEPVISAEEGEE